MVCIEVGQGHDLGGKSPLHKHVLVPKSRYQSGTIEFAFAIIFNE